MRIVSWNVAGLRGLLARRPGALGALMEATGADVLCLQETRIGAAQVPEVAQRLGLGPGPWSAHFACSRWRAGYAGVATLARGRGWQHAEALVHLGARGSGRALLSQRRGLSLLNVYVPNSGEGLRRLDYRVRRWDPALHGLMRRLGPGALLVGDLNAAPAPLDVYDPVRLARVRAAGFTPEERAGLARLLAGASLTDLFRRQWPQLPGYTFFSHRGQMRAKGRGWRLDLALAAPAVAAAALDCRPRPEVLGSDHLPLVVRLDPRRLAAACRPARPARRSGAPAAARPAAGR